MGPAWPTDAAGPAGYDTPRKRLPICVPEPTLPMDIERVAAGFTYDPEAFAAKRE